jgi:hypothetical protein
MPVNTILRTVGKLGLGLALSLAVSADEPTTTTASRIPIPNPPHAKAPVSATQQCVEPTDNMRRYHPQYLQHHRDDTMHQGIRTTKYSLVECINCHVTPNDQGKFPSITTKEHFCRSCHTYVAVTLDCFECHASQPATSLTAVKVPSLKDSFGTSNTTK